MERPAFAGWLDRYVIAWKSYDPQAIGDLFAADAEYRYHPKDEPVVGRDAIVESWLEDRDEPGRFDGEYEPLAIDGDVCIASGWSRYFDASGALDDEYWNVYVCRFDEQGRCRDFVEYWARSREFARRDGQSEDGTTAEGAGTPIGG